MKTSSEIHSMLNAYSDPAVLLSPDYKVLAANDIYLDMYELSANSSVSHCYELSHRYDQPCDQVGELCPMQESKRNGEPKSVLHIHYTPFGKELVNVELYPIKNESGDIDGFLEVMKKVRMASVEPNIKGLVGQSPPFLNMLELIHRVATRDIPVLLLGETGTGKELVATAVHQASHRSQGAFVTVECSGLTESLFESELFGYEKGAFTGAVSSKTGLVESADEGTLFLDEIGDVPLNLQVKLLRLLETGTYRPVGGVESKNTNFRLLCATHQNLEKMVREGSFREDLYYRISTFPIHLPALRERADDIPLLVESLISRIDNTHCLRIHPDALNVIGKYHFPGNIRQLRNILEHASVLCDGDILLPEHFSLEDTLAERDDTHVDDFTIIPLDEVEQDYLKKVLKLFQGERRELANLLGISERTLYRKQQLLGEVN